MASQKTSDSSSESITMACFLSEVSLFLKENQNVSQYELHNLIQEALRSNDQSCDELTTKSLSTKKIMKKRQKSSLTFVLTTATFMLMFFTLSCVKTSFEAKGIFAKSFGLSSMTEKILPDWHYRLVLRPTRIISTYFGLPKIQMMPECFYENPFKNNQPPVALDTNIPEDYIQEEGEHKTCSCETVEHILKINDNFTQFPMILKHNYAQPVMFRQLGPTPTIAGLRQLLLGNAALLSSVPGKVISSNPIVSNMEDLTRADNFDAAMRDSQIHLEWLVEHYMAIAVLRRVFSVPGEVSEHLPTAGGQGMVMLDGGASGHYTLKNSTATMGISLYCQGQGSRKVILVPERSCEGRCALKVTTMHPGDILMFSPAVYSLRSERMGKESSMAYLHGLMMSTIQ